MVTWRSKKHAVVAKSSAKAEFRTMTHDICKLKCVKMMLNELGFNTQESMRLYINNKATINIAHNPVQHDSAKHVEIDRHFIKGKLDYGMIIPICENRRATSSHIN